MTGTITQAKGIEAVEVDPGTLVLGANVRLDARLDKPLVESIRERGVLEPIVAYRDDEGRLVVLMGQRRTTAAVEAERETVPVVVVPKPAEDARLIDQMAENDHRAGLTMGERVEAFAQLALLGMSAAQIAKKSAASRADVDAALVVAKSTTARAAVDVAPTLTLDQAATLTEFEDDEEATRRLIDAAERGGFEHAAQRLRDERAEAAARAKATAKYEAAGATVVPAPHYSDQSTLRLTDLTNPDGEPLTPDAHAECPGRAVYLELARYTPTALDCDCDCEDEDDAPECDCACHADDETQDDEGEECGPRYNGIEVCREWRSHGHRPRYAHIGGRPKAADMTEAERAAEARKRREVIANNKAADSAQVVRREWLTTFATRKTAPKGGPAFVATMLSRWPEYLDEFKTSEVLATILGVESYKTRDHLAGLIEKASDARATHLALIRTIAAVEATTVRDCWRRPNEVRALYLTTIAGWGYELAPIERVMAGLPVEESAAEDEADEQE